MVIAHALIAHASVGQFWHTLQQHEMEQELSDDEPLKKSNYGLADRLEDKMKYSD
jgi:hypothetical protein